MNKAFKTALLVAFVTLLFGFIGFSIDDLLGVNGAVFSSVLAIAAAAAAAFIVYYINKTKEEEKDNKKHTTPRIVLWRLRGVLMQVKIIKKK